MRTKIGIPLFILLLGGLMLLPPSPAAACGGKASADPREPMGNLVVIVHTDDLGSADAALRIAGVAAGRGHKVTMLFRVGAIQFTLKDTECKLGDTTYQEKLAGFMKAGSRVFVGGGCLQQQGIPKTRLIPGVQVGTPDSVMGMIFAKDARIICQ